MAVISSFLPLAGIVLFIAGLFLPTATPDIKVYLMLASITLCSWQILRSACLAVTALRVDYSLLLAVAVVGLLSIGKIFETTIFMCIIATATLMQNQAASFQFNALKKHWPQLPDKITIIDSGNNMVISSADVLPGDTILLAEGDILPVDGIVRAGQASIGQSPVAFDIESSEVRENDRLFAGSMVQKGHLTIEATSSQRDSLFNKFLVTIKQMIPEKEDQANFDYSLNYSRRLLTFIFFMAIPYYFFAPNMLFWFHYSLALLLIFAPYNAIIKTSSLLLAFAMDSVTRIGVIVKRPVALETACTVKAVAFEKVSAITNGNLIMSNIYAPYPFSRPELMRLAIALTQAAKHPLADTIANQSLEDVPSEMPVAQIMESQNYNIHGLVNERTVIIGSNAFLTEKGIKTYVMLRKYDEYLTHGSTVLFVAVDGEAAGLLSFIDDIRPETFSTIRTIRASNIENIIMLTKEQERAALSASRPLGFTQAISNLSGTARAMAVKKIRHNHGSVLMVGNAETDSDSFEHADISVALNARHNPTTALEHADIIMLGEHLTSLADIFLISNNYQKKLKICKKILLISKFLLFFAVAFNFFYLWQALAIDGLVGIMIVVNNRRLSRL